MAKLVTASTAKMSVTPTRTIGISAVVAPRAAARFAQLFANTITATLTTVATTAGAVVSV